MWNNAFTYEPDESRGYTQWFFDGSSNPNDAISDRLGVSNDMCMGPDTSRHKEGPPTREGDYFTECHPWKESACCDDVAHDLLADLTYGTLTRIEYNCGKISNACHQFFVQEGCFYECDSNLLDYRRCTPEEVENGVVLDPGTPEETDCTGRHWQIWKMPIKASYADAWFDACRNDMFCGSGDFFECNMLPPPEESPPKSKKKETLSKSAEGAIIGLAVGLLALCLCAAALVARERSGKPVFTPATQTATGDGHNMT